MEDKFITKWCNITFKIGKKVYVIYDDSITLEYIGYMGEESFIIKEFSDKFEDAIEYFYEDYGRTWFTNFADAKKQVIKDYEDILRKPKLVKRHEGYWELKEGL